MNNLIIVLLVLVLPAVLTIIILKYGLSSSKVDSAFVQKKKIYLLIKDGNYALAKSLVNHLLNKDENNKELLYLRECISRHQGKGQKMEFSIK